MASIALQIGIDFLKSWHRLQFKHRPMHDYIRTAIYMLLNVVTLHGK